MSGIVDWDGGEVAPVEVAYNCPDGSGPTMMKVLLEAAMTRKIWEPDAPVFNDDCHEIKEAFFKEIERLLPRLMEVMRQVRRRPLKKLYGTLRGMECIQTKMQRLERPQSNDPHLSDRRSQHAHVAQKRMNTCTAPWVILFKAVSKP